MPGMATVSLNAAPPQGGAAALAALAVAGEF